MEDNTPIEAQQIPVQSPAQPVAAQSVNQQVPPSSLPSSSHFPKLLIIIIVLLLVAVGSAGAIVLYSKYVKPVSQSTTIVKVFKPMVTPTISLNSTKNMKTYANDLYGFSFQYDSTSEYGLGDSNNTDNTQGDLILRLFSKKLDYNRNWTDPSKPYQLSADDENFFTLEVANKNEGNAVFQTGCVDFDKTKKIIIDGYQGFYGEGASIQGGGQGYSKTICLEKGNFDYEFFTEYTVDSPKVIQAATLQMFNQILSTFKFTQ